MRQIFLDFEQPIADLESKIEELRLVQSDSAVDISEEITRLKKKSDELTKDTYAKLEPWQVVKVARHAQRPYTLDYIDLIFTDFHELHGDRAFADDAAIVGGLARFEGQPCMVIGHQKGRDTKENLLRNFGSAHPEGYRKALRLMRMAEKFSMPVVTLIDTPGAFPGIGAEERNIAEAIAFNLREMMLLRTPIVAVVIGEGGSGGALGIGIADKVLMMENAYYSVISPEGCAAILWKHREHAPEAAQALKLSAQDLKRLGIIGSIIPEPAGGAHHDHAAAASNLKQAVAEAIGELSALSAEQLLEKRYQNFRAMGEVAA